MSALSFFAGLYCGGMLATVVLMVLVWPVTLVYALWSAFGGRFR